MVARKFDMLRLLETSHQTRELLEGIEVAKDSGNSLHASEHHLALYVKALEEGDLDELMEHINAIEDIYASDPIFESALINWRLQVQTFRSMYKVYESSLHLNGDSIDHIKMGLASQLEAMKSQGAAPDAIKSVEISQDLLMREIARDEAQVIADFEIRKMFQAVMKRRSDPKFISRFLAGGLQVQTIRQEIYTAETSSDYKTALKLIAQLEDLCSTEIGSILLSPDDIKTHRENDTAKLKWNEAVLAWKECMVESNYDSARASLETLSSNEVNMSASDAVQEGAQRLWEVTENFQLSSEMEKVKQDLVTNPISAISRSDKLLSMHSDGAFSHIESANLSFNIKIIRLNRYLALATHHDNEGEWDQMIEALDGWLQLNQEAVASDPRSHDNIRDLRETAEFRKHNDAVTVLDRDCRFEEAQVHCEALIALFERQQASPEARRKICPRMTREMLDNMAGQLSIKRGIIDALGLQAGKAYILMARAVAGYNHPNTIQHGWE
jgi:hypothetical protein